MYRQHHIPRHTPLLKRKEAQNKLSNLSQIALRALIPENVFSSLFLVKFSLSLCFFNISFYSSVLQQDSPHSAKDAISED
jgi:hypothetical protein